MYRRRNYCRENHYAQVRAEHLQRLRVTSPETKMHESILRKRNILHETVKHCHHGAQGIPYRADTEQSSGDARVYDNAWVYGDALVCSDEDYAYAHGFGSVNRTTTFFRLKDGGVGVRCGCFYGTLAQFRDKIRETHGETKKAQEYLMLADLMELRFEEDENEVGNRKYVE